MRYVFAITQSRDLLEQYYDLRGNCFREELGVPDFDGSEEEQDRYGTVLLAVDRNRRVLAGARICGHETSAKSPLPLENARFCLRRSFPGLGLSSRSYCHWGRLVIDPGVRSAAFAKNFLQSLISCSAQLGHELAFMVSDRRRCRYYRQLHSALGYDFHISDVEIPGTEGNFGALEHVMSYAVLPSGDSSVQRANRGLRRPVLPQLELVGQRTVCASGVALS